MKVDGDAPRAGAASIVAGAGQARASGREAILSGSPLRDVAGAARAGLLDVGTFEQLAPGRVLTTEGQPVSHLVLLGSGRVKVERARAASPGAAPGETTCPLGHRGPGEMVGESGIAVATSAETATVVDAGEALLVPMTSFRRLLGAEPGLRKVVIAALLAQERAVHRRLEALLLHGVEVRLARFLLDAAGRWGAPHDRGQLVTAGFTHADVALLIGSTRETVTLLLGKLRREGLVEFERRRLVIRDRAALERLAAASGA
jgi:CRP-like cAMP-binding protein